MKKRRVRDKFIEELRNTGIVQIACDKIGISRQTYYRWLKEDVDFRLSAGEAISQGEDLVNDFAESNVLRGIQNQSESYTKYWLSVRHPKFNKKYIRRNTRVRYDSSEFMELEKLWFAEYEDGSEEENTGKPIS